MLSLQPAKTSTPNDVDQQPSPAIGPVTGPSKYTSPSDGDAIKPAERSSKRRKLNIADAPSDKQPPKSTTHGRGSTPRPAHKPPTRQTPSLPAAQINRIDKYFTCTEVPGDDLEEDELQQQRKTRTVSLYDTYQKRVQDATTKSQDKRTLRSHDDGGRLKSELAVYFPFYDDIINDVPKPKELINADTVLIFKDAKKAGPPPPSTSKASHAAIGKTTALADELSNGIERPLKPADPGLNGAQILDFSNIEKSVPHHPKDPLTDDIFHKAHRRAERREKQLRNIERERAMHEKAQLERLLDGLKGHDWLRVMGITGVTDTEAQRYQEKREFFLSEVKALVRKFVDWREEEKRLKLEKGAAHRAEDETEVGADDDSDRLSREPSAIDANASTARQQQIDTHSTSRPKAKLKLKFTPAASVPPPRPPPPQGPFLSFFEKPHLRTAALGKARHGRSVLAFGHPIPDLPDREFLLPDDYISADALKESARRRRRSKRESAADLASSSR